MNKFIIFILCFLTLTVLISLIKIEQQYSFLTQQLKYSRVKSAYNEKINKITNELTSQGFSINKFNVLLIAKKDNSILEIFVKNKSDNKYLKFKEYNICEKSGKLGPKRREGDFQVPEGFYYINRFNPTSQFYLSLGISYPNESDKIIIGKNPSGGDIYIHGSCVTIGCLPMTDDIIKEIYLLCVFAKNNGQKKIPIYIFPCNMKEKEYDVILNKYKDDTTTINFWTNIKKGHDLFFLNYKELKYSINSKGEYIFQDN